MGLGINNVNADDSGAYDLAPANSNLTGQQMPSAMRDIRAVGENSSALPGAPRGFENLSYTEQANRLLKAINAPERSKLPLEKQARLFELAVAVYQRILAVSVNGAGAGPQFSEARERLELADKAKAALDGAYQALERFFILPQAVLRTFVKDLGARLMQNADVAMRQTSALNEARRVFLIGSGANLSHKLGDGYSGVRFGSDSVPDRMRSTTNGIGQIGKPKKIDPDQEFRRSRFLGDSSSARAAALHSGAALDKETRMKNSQTRQAAAAQAADERREKLKAQMSASAERLNSSAAVSASNQSQMQDDSSAETLDFDAKQEEIAAALALAERTRPGPEHAAYKMVRSDLPPELKPVPHMLETHPFVEKIHEVAQSLLTWAEFEIALVLKVKPGTRLPVEDMIIEPYPSSERADKLRKVISQDILFRTDWQEQLKDGIKSLAASLCADPKELPPGIRIMAEEFNSAELETYDLK